MASFSALNLRRAFSSSAKRSTWTSSPSPSALSTRLPPPRLWPLKRSPREALKSERGWRELRDQVYRAVAEWHRQCFGRRPWSEVEVVNRHEEYAAMCQLYRLVKEELGDKASLYASDFSLRCVF